MTDTTTVIDLTSDDDFLRGHAATIRNLGKRMVGDIVEIGRLLTECKERLGHGRWLPWLQAEFGWSDDTALRFMRTHDLIKSRNLRNMANLTIDASALYLLASRSTPEPIRDEVLNRAQAGEPITHADVKRQVVMAAADRAEARAKQVEKAARRAAREYELAAKITALPSKRYGVILADPPWRFEVRSRESGLDRSPDQHYPTQTVDQIAALDVVSIAADDCVLFLWATAPMLLVAASVMADWGFDYRSHCVWTKDRPGTGYWFRSQHEILLLGVKGNPPCPAPGTQWSSVIEEPRGDHSAKPERVLEMVEQYFPTIPKIELHRRGPPRPGWDAWGNEVESAVESIADSDEGMPDIPDFLRRSRQPQATA